MKQKSLNKVKISIITVSYNSEKTIKDTLESVLSQNYDNYEHIIVDGNSKDNTMKIVKAYEKKYNGRLKYVSESDKGLYDAMNKGIEMCTGDIIGILNSDDKYYNNNVLNKISKTIDKNVDGVYANLLYVDEETMEIPKRKWISGIGSINYGWLPAHPTLYIRKKIYEEIGKYNINYRIVADYDFMVRLYKTKKYNIKYINEYLILMRLGGVSSAGIKGYYRNIKEAYKALKTNKIGFPFPLGVIIIRIFKTIKQYICAKFER